jgi:hypothetical protein
MIPRLITDQLGKLRSREMTLRLCWGVARWLAVVIPALIVACTIDFLFDRYGYEDTPLWVRGLLFVTQIGIAAGVCFWWIVWPIVRQPSQEDLALYVEEKLPGFRHRLISTVQLNQPGARKEGMSQELIDVVTRETERQAEDASFAALADHSRFAWSGALASPIVLVGILLLVLVPLAPVLLARQLPWIDEELPRSIRIENLTKEIWPSGESVLLKFKVTGEPVEAYKQAVAGSRKSEIDEALEDLKSLDGTARIVTEDSPIMHSELRFVRVQGDWALFEATVPSMTTDFSFTARLGGDGRMRRPGHVHFVPRPIINDSDIKAWVRLPLSCDPDGKRRFELPPSAGEIVAIDDCAARVEIAVQNPIKVATLYLVREVTIKDKLKGSTDAIRMGLNKDGKKATCTFELGRAPKGEGVKDFKMSYYIEVADENGFKNGSPPRRDIKIVEENPPRVELLPTVLFGPNQLSYTSEEILQGMPTFPGNPIPVAYTCSGQYGMHRAVLRYSFPKKMESGETPPEEESWTPFPLDEKVAGQDVGEFVSRVGRFRNSADQIQFHAVPSPPWLPDQLGRLEGGGNFMFQTEKLYSGGKDVTLKAGDQIAFFIEVYAGPDHSRPVARSEIRVVDVLKDAEECRKWRSDQEKEQLRIKSILDKQLKQGS